jgi:tetratricopeptide (TPR) repeat protein
MRLNIALGMFSHNTNGPLGGRTSAIERAIEAGRRLNQPGYEVEPLISLATAHLGAGEHLLSIEVSNRAIQLGRDAGLPMAVLAAERVLAQAHHFNGDQVTSAETARRVIDHPAVKLPLTYNLTPVDRHVSMRIILARIFWIRGRFEEAQRLLQDTVVIARNDGAFSLCPTLAFCAIPIALWNGDDVEAQRLNLLLTEEAKRYTLGYWQHWADAFDVALRVRAGEQDLRPALSDSLQFETLATLSPRLLTPEAAARATRGWCAPEILRAQGEWLLSQRAPGAAREAEALFQEAVNMAQSQGALAWQLRAATSLARLVKTRAARESLAEALGQCQQGLRTADMTSATAVLDTQERDEVVARTVRNRPVRRRVGTARRIR